MDPRVLVCAQSGRGHSGGHILERGPRDRPRATIFMTKFNVAKSGSISRIQVCLPSRPKPCPSGLGSKSTPSSARVCPKRSGAVLCVWPHKPFRTQGSGLGSKNGPSSARVWPKWSGPRSAAKQGRSLCVAPLNHGGPMNAPRSRVRVLQQNRAVLCVWPH